MLEAKNLGNQPTRPRVCGETAWKTSKTSVRSQRRDWWTGDVFTGSNRFKMKESDQETERLMLASICESLMKVQKSHTHKNKPTRTKETENRTHVCVLKAAD